MINQDWIKRRWLDFRHGHSVYLIFIVQFMQFVIVTYELNIKGLGIFPSIFYWVGFFILTYLPAALIIGHFHLKKQIPTEQKQLVDNNPFTFQTAPGKEQLYQLPANLMGYRMQLRSMEMANQNAAIWEKILPILHPQMKGVVLPKWTDADFKEIMYWKAITERLQKGENIVDIVGTSPAK